MRTRGEEPRRAKRLLVSEQPQGNRHLPGGAPRAYPVERAKDAARTRGLRRARSAGADRVAELHDSHRQPARLQPLPRDRRDGAHAPVGVSQRRARASSRACAPGGGPAASSSPHLEDLVFADAERVPVRSLRCARSTDPSHRPARAPHPGARSVPALANACAIGRSRASAAGEILRTVALPFACALFAGWPGSAVPARRRLLGDASVRMPVLVPGAAPG